jgi:uncharacterized membrane protein YoaK (UPF0700 family)
VRDDVFHWLPTVFIALGAIAIVTAFRVAPQRANWSDLKTTPVMVVIFIADAVIPGESMIERVCQGIAAALVAIAMVIFGWRMRHRSRRLPTPSATELSA